MNQTATLGQNLVSGFGAGIAGTLVAFPFDVLKTHLQGGSVTVRQAARNIRRGSKSACRALGVNLIGVGPEKAVALAVNAGMLGLLERTDPGCLSGTTTRQVVAGAVAGGVKCVITVPLEMVKIRLQTGRFREGLLRELKRFSFRALYTGYVMTLCRDVGFGVCLFTIQAQVKSLAMHRHHSTSDGGLTPPAQQHGQKGEQGQQGQKGQKGQKGQQEHHRAALPLSTSLVAGLIGGTVGAAMTNPFDSIKTRVQLRGAGDNTHGQRGDLFTSLSVAKRMHASEGVGSFFRGLVPRAVTVGILYGTIIMAFDGFRRLES